MLPFRAWLSRLRRPPTRHTTRRRPSRFSYRPRAELLEDRLAPANVVFSNPPVGSYPQFSLVDPNATSGGNFGATVHALPSGNIVVTAPNDTVNGVTGAGAVYLYNGQTGALISALTGTTTNDHVGSAGDFVDSVVVLTNGNYVVVSSDWNNGTATGAGAVTFGDGITGVSGTVDDTNSLVGSTANDHVGLGDGAVDVVALTNGNYVVGSPSWTNDTAAGAGAATAGNGIVGTVGAVSADNSLVGSTANDGVGKVIVALTNGSYVVGSPGWTNAGAAGAGAATFGGRTNGIVGPVTDTNSLVGTQAGDGVGGVIVPLTNGNYVVVSPNWANDSATQAGAVTFASGVHRLAGPVSEANSLVGTQTGDQVGFDGVAALKNGNYVVGSSQWANGSAAQAGAATFADGTAGVSGTISAANSLVGLTAGDQVGNHLLALSNGNYVVGSPSWNNGSLAQAGAATFGDGTHGVSGNITLANSLAGTHAGDQVGQVLTALTNGNYVVGSPQWSSDTTAGVGAATFGDGTHGVSGPVSPANSLIGSTANDAVGASATALTNGNYLVVSPFWNNGTAAQAGAATFGDGTHGVTGVVSAANSLVGTHTNDLVGVLEIPGPFGGTFNNAVVALTNGNYVVVSPDWNNGTATRVGAATFGSGTAGVSGPISVANSLVGSTSGDQVGSFGTTALGDGNYVVGSPLWTNDTLAQAGAATFVSGTTGQTIDGSNTISAQNSIIGGVASDLIAPVAEDKTDGTFVATGVADDGRVVIGLTNPNQLTADLAPDQTLDVTPAFLTGTLNAGTAVTVQSGTDLTVDSPITASAGGHGGALTLQASDLVLNAGISTDGGALTLIGTISPQGDSIGAVALAAPTTFDSTSTYAVQIQTGGGTTEADEIDVTGTLNLDDATLSIDNPGDTPLGVPVVIARATGGFGGSEFNNQPDGSTIDAGGQTFRVNYTSNAVTLTVVEPPLTWTGANSGLWNDPGNWDLDVVPQNGQDLIFPQSAANHANTNNIPGLTRLDSITLTGQADPANPYKIDPGSIAIGAPGIADVSTPAAGATTVDTFLGSVNVTNTISFTGSGTPINVASSGIELDLASGLAGSGGFTKTGAGTLRLAEGASDTATVGGSVVVGAGTLLVDAAHFTAPSVAVLGGATLSGGGVLSASVVVNAGGKLIGGGTPAGSTSAEPDLAVLGPVTLAAGSAFTVVTSFGPTGLFTGFEASGAVTIQPNVQVALQVPNNFTAPSAANKTQTIVFSGAGFSGTFASLPSGSVLTVNNQQFGVANFQGTNGGVTLTYLGHAPAGPQVDLTATVDDGISSFAAGQNNTYTIVVRNTSAQTKVTGATVSDVFPATMRNITWTAAASAGSSVARASGSGNISTTVTLAPGGSVTFTAHVTVSSTVTGSLSQSATITAPNGIVDVNTGNNIGTDTDTVIAPVADLSITATDSGNGSAVPGLGLTYTIVVHNNSNLQVLGASVTDLLPATLTKATWTAKVSAGSSIAQASGSGSISTTVNLIPGGTVTYTLKATVDQAATGQLVNTPTVAVPAGFTDPSPANNSAAHAVNLTPRADLSVSMTANSVRAGQPLTFVITVTNKGPSAATGVLLQDLLTGPASSFSAGVTQGNLSVSGGLVTANLGTIVSGGTARLVIVVNTTAAGGITSQAATASLVTDPVTSNNVAKLTATVQAPIVLSPWIASLLLFPYHFTK